MVNGGCLEHELSFRLSYCTLTTSMVLCFCSQLEWRVAHAWTWLLGYVARAQLEGDFSDQSSEVGPLMVNGGCLEHELSLRLSY